MKHIITTEQINGILDGVYQTNIPASQFDLLKKLFNQLPVIKEEKPVEATTDKDGKVVVKEK